MYSFLNIPIQYQLYHINYYIINWINRKAERLPDGRLRVTVDVIGKGTFKGIGRNLWGAVFLFNIIQPG